MKQRALTIEELCRRHGNEEVHTDHVTRLALGLFDRTRRALAMPGSDRVLLEAACRLHDVGFRDKPLDHARHGAALVLDKGLRGFTPAQRAYVAGAIFLHAGTSAPALDDPLVARLPNRRCLLRLAALLRVADALDHGHVQDASLVSVRRRTRGLHVRVSSPAYDGNVGWAEKKADLWPAAFAGGITFEREPEAGHEPFEHMMRIEDSANANARRLLYILYRTAADNRAGAGAGGDTEHVHDFRVAARRFRAAVKLFRDPLAGTAEAPLSRLLSAFSRGLGPTRDSQVWLRFLASPACASVRNAGPEWSAYLQSERDRYSQRVQTFGPTLNGDDYKAVAQQITFMLRSELPNDVDGPNDGPLVPVLSRRLGRLYRRVLRAPPLRRRATPDDLHEWRKTCRLGRYWAEFAAAPLGPAVRRLARRFKAAADALGDVHDMDVQLRNMNDLKTEIPVPPGLRALVIETREQAWKDTQKAWRGLHKKALRRRVMKELGACRT